MTAPPANTVGSTGSSQVQEPSVTDTSVEFHKIYSHWANGREEKALELVDAFGDDARGHVRSVQLYRNITAVALLTDANKAAARNGRAIHVEWAPGCTRSHEAQAILGECQDLHNRALLYLQPKPQRVCVGQLFGIVTTVLGQLEAAADGPSERNGQGRHIDVGPVLGVPVGVIVGDAAPTDDDEWAPVRRRLDGARRYYLDSAQRSAQIRYFLGALAGLVVVALAPLIESADALLPGRADTRLATAVIAGAIGATVSVMTRITSGELVLDDLEETRDLVLVAFGAVRPVIGAVFGALLCAVLVSGMVPIAFPPKPDDLFLIGAFAFVTGFSERFAQDVLSRVESSLPPGGQPARTERARP